MKFAQVFKWFALYAEECPGSADAVFTALSCDPLRKAMDALAADSEAVEAFLRKHKAELLAEMRGTDEKHGRCMDCGCARPDLIAGSTGLCDACAQKRDAELDARERGEGKAGE